MNDNEINSPLEALYTIDNLFYAEKVDTGWYVYSIYQRERNIDISVRLDNGITYCFATVHRFQITRDTTYLRGDEDYSKDVEVREIAYGGYFENFRQACEKIPDKFAIVYDRKDIEKYLAKPVVEEDKKDLYDIVIDGTPTDDEINEMISKVNLDNFIKMIQARVVRDIQHGDTPSQDFKSFNKKWAKKYLKDWARSKYRFYKLFNNNLTIETEVEQDIDDNDIRTSLTELYTKFPLYAVIISKFSIASIKNNHITKSSCSSNHLSEVIDKEGTTFTKFMSLYKNKELDMEISKIYQDKGKSKIVASIDPIDYLSVSINTGQWESCHHFYNGCYRNAGLSYMLDDTSLVGYATKGTALINCYDRKLEFVNKRWREMIYVSKTNSTIVFSRQYPNFSTTYSKALRELMEEQISKKYDIKNLWLLVNKTTKYAKVETTGTLYNDVSCGFDFTEIINKYDKNKDLHIIDIGICAKKMLTDDTITDGEEDIC